MNEMPRPAARKKASDFDQRILEIFDGYVHGKMSTISSPRPASMPPPA